MADRVPESPEWVTLAADERVWLVASPSNNLVLASLGVGFVLLVVMSAGVGFVTSLATGRVLSFVTLVLIVALLVGAYAIVRTREYLLTSDRAVIGVGLTEKRATAVDIDAVDEVQIRQPGWQRLVDIGTVRIVTVDGDSVEFGLVENPDEIGREVRRLVQAEVRGEAGV